LEAVKKAGRDSVLFERETERRNFQGVLFGVFRLKYISRRAGLIRNRRYLSV
jgi:hypothetical protein